MKLTTEEFIHTENKNLHLSLELKIKFGGEEEIRQVLEPN